MPDLYNVKNFSVSLVATAPSPATSGTSLVVTAGHGTRFPAAYFQAVIWPQSQAPTVDNSEIVKVTAVSTDTFTIERSSESTAARSIVVGDQISAVLTAEMFGSNHAPTGSGDAYKLVRFTSVGELKAANGIFVNYGSVVHVGILPGYLEVINASGTFKLNWNGHTATRNMYLPDTSGTLLVGVSVHFDGSANSNQAATYGRTGTTVTVALTAHGHIVGHVVQIDFTSGGALDGLYTIITVPDANSFTVTTAASGTISAGSTMNLLRCTMNSSYGVHSVTDAGTGLYYANFSSAFPDAFYRFHADAGSNGANRLTLFGLTPTAQAIRITTATTGVVGADAEFVSFTAHH